MFDNNLRLLLQALKPGGMLFLTVRHEGFLKRPVVKARRNDFARLARDGFWFRPQRQSDKFGLAVIATDDLANLSVAAAIDYLGPFEPHQHLYRLTAWRDARGADVGP